MLLKKIQTSLRKLTFCTRCSFPLAKVKEVVETEVAKSKAEEKKRIIRYVS